MSLCSVSRSALCAGAASCGLCVLVSVTYDMFTCVFIVATCGFITLYAKMQLFEPVGIGGHSLY